ncbi:NUDIX hydrolase [Candidatus Gracilibacteria bacterium]|nr:NUDIX hydrolase [Candidatus Gracilibacteria bacterium]
MDLLQELDIFGKNHPHRRIFSERCINFFRKNNGSVQIFQRDFFNDGHFTAGVLLFNPERTKVLLMQSKKTGTWQQFGGHADGKKNLREVALREFEEESGISVEKIILDSYIGSVDIHYVPEVVHPKHGFEPEHYHYDINFFGSVSEDTIFGSNDHDVKDITWFTFEELTSNIVQISSGMQTMVDEYFLSLKSG